MLIYSMIQIVLSVKHFQVLKGLVTYKPARSLCLQMH